MAQPDDRASKRRVEHEIEELKTSIEKYLHPEVQVTSEAVTDLTKAIQNLSSHVANLHRRIETIEQTHDDWTTHGWMPPPGSDRPS